MRTALTTVDASIHHGSGWFENQKELFRAVTCYILLGSIPREF
ncbi:MAG TPA: hypothetical protein VGN17_19000 [Bryobacteraceae bacterium]